MKAIYYDWPYEVYDKEVFFPVSWEYQDVLRWAEQQPPMWWWVLGINPRTGQYSALVLMNMARPEDKPVSHSYSEMDLCPACQRVHAGECRKEDFERQFTEWHGDSREANTGCD